MPGMVEWFLIDRENCFIYYDIKERLRVEKGMAQNTWEQ